MFFKPVTSPLPLSGGCEWHNGCPAPNFPHKADWINSSDLHYGSFFVELVSVDVLASEDRNIFFYLLGLMINTYYFQDITHSPPKTDQRITNKWTSEQQAVFCSPLYCASNIIGLTIDILWDTNQASPSRALGVWITHVIKGIQAAGSSVPAGPAITRCSFWFGGWFRGMQLYWLRP